ncbi:MAG: hypothetical protein JO188_12020, partial [Hyphomicrobiales bacterium]|nr:hypothetical protein [Hyphomicrobiales bacterium]
SLWVARSFSSVVQAWPSQPTNCRSSVQIGQREGGASVGENCVPQVTQMKGVVAASFLHSSRLN